jgi:hypothetical protein
MFRTYNEMKSRQVREVSLETTLSARDTDKVSWFNCDTIVALLLIRIRRRGTTHHHVLHQLFSSLEHSSQQE